MTTQPAPAAVDAAKAEQITCQAETHNWRQCSRSATFVAGMEWSGRLANKDGAVPMPRRYAEFWPVCRQHVHGLRAYINGRSATDDWREIDQTGWGAMNGERFEAVPMEPIS